MRSPEKPLSAREARRALRCVTRGGVLLRPGHGSGTGVQRVRNVETGRILPCCWQECDITNPGDNRYRVEIPHPQPRWRDPATGRQEMLVYIFCSQRCRKAWLTGTPYADKV